mmetsp:Transcript_39222/g.91952  ORF Transcript_39222/g.91952 Transcript_39222/m.91952 type:complete len:121 (+) Transcript_39222:54-416(+)
MAPGTDAEQLSGPGRSDDSRGDALAHGPDPEAGRAVWAAQGWSSAGGQEELTQKLEDLQKGLTLAETSTRWLQAPTQNSSLVLADLTTREEMRWLTDLTLKLGERCGRLRAGALLVGKKS